MLKFWQSKTFFVVTLELKIILLYIDRIGVNVILITQNNALSTYKFLIGNRYLGTIPTKEQSNITLGFRYMGLLSHIDR